ncbi:pyridoxal-phosphate dependent enzyme [Paenibacillus sp. CC-CFT747]|nr:pyridoxal-phosphate dependent enzyme [Paenibacillus sp. CC-CFT747]
MEAQRLLKGIIHETPLQASRTFSAMSESQVYLKLENLQKTGAFKIRGAFVKAARLTAEARAKGLITASAGNHAQGVACAAAHFGVPSVIVMPEGAPAAKVQATEGYGSKVVLHGANYDEAYRHALQLSEEKGACFVHAFDDEDIISGQGTVGLEILQSLPDVEAIVVPVGGGGLISGIAAAVKTLKPEVEIIGVQPEQASSGFLSWQAGQRIIVPAPGPLPTACACKPRPSPL